MGRLISQVKVRGPKRTVTSGCLVDPGAAVTVVSNLVATNVGFRCGRRKREMLGIAGQEQEVCYTRMDLLVPGTDCLLERARVAVVARPEQDTPGVLLGADFWQRAGGILDFRRGKHSIACDPNGRSASPKPFVQAKRQRLAARRRRNGR
jgi:hypothetical protein